MIRKLLFILCFSAVCSLVNAQAVVLQEDFNSYSGSTSVPAGWYFSYNGHYTSTSSSGTSGPNSYKFGADGASIVTPAFSSADSVSFWMKGNGVDTLSTLYVLESADSATWDTIATINHLPTVGTTVTYAVKNTSKYLMFTYHKSVGNLAFDDFMLTQNVPIYANFSASGTCVGDTTMFTDMSSSSQANISKWMWSFGDGGIDSVQNPTHFYANAGTYSVTLVIMNDSSNTDSTTKMITIGAKPVAGFTATTVCAGNATHFTDTSTTANSSLNSWKWTFGDGANSTTQNPSHTFAAAGSYNVTLMVTTAAGCADTVSDSAYVNPVPVAAFTDSVNGDTVMFADASTGTPNSWSWNFGDGSGTSTMQNPTYGYAFDGTYSAMLTVTNSYGCADSVSHQVILFTTGIQDNHASGNILVYPNPSVNGTVNITFTNASTGPKTIAVYTMQGQLVEWYNVTTTNKYMLNLSGLSVGNYLLSVKTSIGTTTRKILVK